jgi:ribose transport system permease protein
VGLIKAPSLSLASRWTPARRGGGGDRGDVDLRRAGAYSGTIVGALILTVLTTMLTVLQMPEGTRRILFGAIILG